MSGKEAVPTVVGMRVLNNHSSGRRTADLTQTLCHENDHISVPRIARAEEPQYARTAGFLVSRNAIRAMQVTLEKIAVCEVGAWVTANFLRELLHSSAGHSHPSLASQWPKQPKETP